MRRNRRRGKYRDASGNTLAGDGATLAGDTATSAERYGVPTLTDALAVDAGTPLVPTVVLPDVTADADPISLDTLSDLPVLTDAVAIVAPGGVADAAPSEAALEPLVPEEAASAAGPGAPGVPASPEVPARPEVLASPEVPEATTGPVATAATASSLPAALVDEEFILEIPPVDADAPVAMPQQGIESPEAVEGGAIPEPILDGIDAPAAVDAKDAFPEFSPGDRDWGGEPASTPAPMPEADRAPPDWGALADEIRAQVMQRLDLFTDTGLREQLGARLQPIVARASSELVDTINRQVGELVRSYVAEAIEREIDSWRSRHP